MANFGWAYVNCDDTSGASIYGPTGSILFLTGSQAASGSALLLYYTASAPSEHPYNASTLVLTGTLIVTGTISASNYHIEDIAIIDATGSTYFGDDQTDMHARTGSLEMYNDSTLVFKVPSDASGVSGSGAWTVGSSLTVTGPISGSGAGSFGTLSADEGVNFQSSGLTNAGAVSGVTTLTGSGAVTLGGNLTATGDISGSGVLTVNGNAAFNNQITVLGTLRAEGSTTLAGTTNIGDAVGDVATVTGHLTASNGIEVSGLANFNSSVILANESSDTVTVHGYLSSSAAATIKGNIVGGADLRITGSSDPAGSLTYDGALLNVTGDLTASSGISASYFMGYGGGLTGIDSTAPGTGGASGRLALWNSNTELSGSPDLIFDSSNLYIGGLLGDPSRVTVALSASGELEIVGDARLGSTLSVTGGADFESVVSRTTLTVDGISALDGGVRVGADPANLLISIAGDIHAQGDIFSSGSCIFGNQNSDVTKVTGSFAVYRDSGEQIFGISPLTYTTTVGGFRGNYQQIVADLQTGSTADYLVGFATGDTAVAYCVLSASTAGVGSVLILKDEFTGTRTTGSGIYVSSSGADTIDGQGYYKITGSMASINLYSDGISKWFIF